MPALFHAVLNAFQAFLNGIQPNIKKADIIACFFRFFGGAFGAVPGKRCFLRKADPFFHALPDFGNGSFAACQGIAAHLRRDLVPVNDGAQIGTLIFQRTG